MDFNIKTQFKSNPFKAISLVLIGVILIVMTWSTISSSGENKRLKRAINEKLLEIKVLELEKNSIFESIEKDSLAIIAKDVIILRLSEKEYSLKNKLKHLKNERIKIQNAYFNNAVTERIRIFSELATRTETDSIR